MICNPNNDKNTRLIRLLTDDSHRMLRHICMIAVFFTIFLSARILFVKDDIQYTGNAGILHSIIPFIMYTGVLYINIYILMPLFFSGKYHLYIILVMGLSLTTLLIMRYGFDPLFESYRTASRKHGLDDVVTFICATIFTVPIILVSNTMRLMQKWIKDSQRLTELDTLTVNMELTALKNQVNPHFLFNMLNNVNVLIKNSPDKASAVIIKLSEFLRHQLYENNDETTSLMAETAFLSNFLNLEKIRRDNFVFTIRHFTNGLHLATIQVPPNLFTTFVENAIKHSVDLDGNETVITIIIAIEDNMLTFSCTNTVSAGEQPYDPKNGGLGLININRRLSLLYGNRYTLTNTAADGTYNITLTLPL